MWRLTNSPCHRWSKRLWTNVSNSVRLQTQNLFSDFCCQVCFMRRHLQWAAQKKKSCRLSPWWNYFQKRRICNHLTAGNLWRPLEPTMKMRMEILVQNMSYYSALTKLCLLQNMKLYITNVELLKYSDSSVVSTLWRKTFPSLSVCRYSLSADIKDNIYERFYATWRLIYPV